MPVATVTFKKCLFNTPACGAGEGRVGSRVFFDLDIDGVLHPDLFVDLIHSASDGADDPPIKIAGPRGCAGPFNAPVFRDCLLFYYNQVVGARGLRAGLKFFRSAALTPEMRVQFDIGL